MPLACPVCKAENTAGPGCRRCKADLSLLFDMENQRPWLLQQTRWAFQIGRLDDALQYARLAHDIKNDSASFRWLAVLNLLTNRLTEAWNAYESACGHD